LKAGGYEEELVINIIGINGWEILQGVLAGV